MNSENLPKYVWEIAPMTSPRDRDRFLSFWSIEVSWEVIQQN